MAADTRRFTVATAVVVAVPVLAAGIWLLADVAGPVRPSDAADPAARGGGAANAAIGAPDDAGNSDVIVLSETQLSAMKVEAVAKRAFPIEKTAIGSIDFNGDLTVQVFTPYQGRIVELFAKIGDDVKKGDTLFTIASPDLLQAESNLISSAGVLQLTGAFNYTKNAITHIDPLPAQLSTEPSLIDSITYIAITAERPDWRATVTPQYTVGRFHALARASYYGKFSSAQPGFCDLCRDFYGAKTLFDVEAGYQFNQVNISVGIRNLFDTYPDQPSSLTDISTGGNCITTGGTCAKDYNNNFGTFPWAAASPFGYNGRYIYARLEAALTR